MSVIEDRPGLSIFVSRTASGNFAIHADAMLAEGHYCL
jgi:hypothetical protein